MNSVGQSRANLSNLNKRCSFRHEPLNAARNKSKHCEATVRVKRRRMSSIFLGLWLTGPLVSTRVHPLNHPRACRRVADRAAGSRGSSSIPVSASSRRCWWSDERLATSTWLGDRAGSEVVCSCSTARLREANERPRVGATRALCEIDAQGTCHTGQAAAATGRRVAAFCQEDDWASEWVTSYEPADLSRQARRSW